MKKTIKKGNIKFVIVSMRQRTGGAIVLHLLCQQLNRLGYNAKMFYPLPMMNDKPRKKVLYWFIYYGWFFWDLFKKCLAVMFSFTRFGKNAYVFKGYCNVPIRGCKRKWLPKIDNNTIVVYPEIYWGNLLNAEKVVRWLLYTPLFIDNISEAYGKNELVFAYRSIYNDKTLNPTCRLFEISYYDLDLYKKYNFGKRKGKAFIIRKGGNRSDLPSTFDGIIIDKLSEKEIVEVFNKCKYCISYDTQTSYSLIAAVCGCISIVVPEDGKNVKDYREEEELDLGIAWGFDRKSLLEAKKKMGNVEKYLVKKNKKSYMEIDRFVKECRQNFKI